MGKISKTYYEVIDSDILNITEAGEFYYHNNVISLHPMFHKEYEEYEINQLNVKHNLIGEALKRNDIERPINMNDTILGISAIKNKVILIT